MLYFTKICGIQISLQVKDMTMTSGVRLLIGVSGVFFLSLAVGGFLILYRIHSKWLRGELSRQSKWIRYLCIDILIGLCLTLCIAGLKLALTPKVTFTVYSLIGGWIFCSASALFLFWFMLFMEGPHSKEENS